VEQSSVIPFVQDSKVIKVSIHAHVPVDDSGCSIVVASLTRLLMTALGGIVRPFRPLPYSLIYDIVLGQHPRNEPFCVQCHSAGKRGKAP
jgi:hypothetical protein